MITLLEDIKMLEVNFVMIEIIQKISVLLKIARILKQGYKRLLFFQKNNYFFFHDI